MRECDAAQLAVDYLKWFDSKHFVPEPQLDMKDREMDYSTNVLFCVKNLVGYDFQTGWYRYADKEWESDRSGYSFSKGSEVVGWCYLFPPMNI
jgi:hypothetical protein